MIVLNSLIVPKNAKEKPFGSFQHHFIAKVQKISEVGLFGDIKTFSEKSLTCRKNLKGAPIVSPGIVSYAERQEELL